MIDYFISKYENQNKFADDKNWSPYQHKTFIELAFVVHKNPKMANITEQKQIAMLHFAGSVSSDSEIFFSENTTQTELNKIFENPDSSSSNGSSNFTLIEGAPGIGKTVVAKEIACRWAQKTMLFNIKLLLLISFRETDISQIKSFKELMLHCYGEDEKAASSCAEYFIRTQGKSLMIIFDGYDEMATEEQRKNDSIFKRLLAKDSMPECHLVVTSRPYVTGHLRPYCNCRVEIMGFTNNDRLEYFKKNLSSEQFIFVTEFLRNNLIIDSLCYIPLNLISFLNLVEHTMNKDELPITQTKLTEYTVRLTIARNIGKKDKKIVRSFQHEEIEKIIKSLAPIAYKMLNKDKLVFSEVELKGAVKDDENKYGLLRAVQINTMDGQPEKLYSFIHFSVQEYLAAYYLSKRSSIVQSLQLGHKFYNDKYFGVWGMYIGLTGGNKFPLQKFLSNQSYFTASLRHFFGFRFPGIHKKFKDNKITYLRLYQMFLEAPESKIGKCLEHVVTSDTLNLSEQNFTSDDMSMLAYFVARSCITQQWESINLSGCNIDDDKLYTFKHKLCIEDGRKKPVIKYLDISGNCNIRKLNAIVEFITECNLISKLKASKIFKDDFNTAIVTVSNCYCNRTLQILDLSENHLQNDNVHDLCNALVHCKNLKKLDLSKNEIDDGATGVLAKAIVQWDKLQILKIENNTFSDDSTRLIEFVIAHHLECNSHVTISPDGEIPQKWQRQITTMLQGSGISLDSSSYTKETKTLDFKGQTEYIKYFIALLGYTNDVLSENSTYIDCISQLLKLSLECVQSEGIALTKNASVFFKDHFKNLEEINLSGVAISEESAEAMAFGNRLQCIKMNSCKLSSKAAVFIANRLKKAGSIEEIELCNNYLDDEATEGLVAAFLYCNSLVRFDYTGNNFSRKTELLFEFFLPHLKFSDLSLNLSGSLNNMSSFITLLGYMKEVPTDKSCYVKNISKITKLNLNCLNHQTDTPLRLIVTSSEGFQIFNCLKSLNISGITVNDNIANHLVKVFKNNSQLEQLFMNKCQITSPTIKLFCQQLKFNSKLKVFELSENSVDDEVIEELAIAILHWNLLESIKIEKNWFSNHGMLLLGMLTQDMKPESTIHFGNNSSVIKSFIKVLDYVSNNITGVRVTQFFNNLLKITELSMEVKTQVELTINASVTLKNLRNLVSLNVSGVAIREEVANNLCDLFNENIISLKQLIMNDCGLNSNVVTKFADILKLTVRIEDVQFCNNKIDDNATKSLAITILHWKTLRAIKLENNHFTNDSIIIFDMLKFFPNTFIDFNGRIDKIIPFITLLGYMTDIDIKNSVLVEDVSKTQQLLLDCSELNNTNVQFEVNASRYFTRFVSLTHLNISGIGISKEVADNLAKALDSNLCSLEHLIMNNCQLTSVNSINIIKKVRKCVKMRELQLSNNFIHDEDAEDLVVSILHLNALEILRLENNSFSKKHDKVFCFLANNIKFSDSKIDFSNNIYSVISFLTLLEYMTIISVNVSQFVDNISKVKSLNLDCSIQNTRYEELELTCEASQFFQRFQLTNLNLSGIHVTGEVVDSICKAFGADLTSVEYLLMNNCNLRSSSVIKLMEILQNAKHIKEIELCNNEIDDEAMESLVEAILHCDLLERVTTEDNNFTQDNTKVLEVLNGFLKFCDTLIDFNGRTDNIIPFIALLGYMVDVDIDKSVLVNNVTKIKKLILNCSEQSSNKVKFEVIASKFFTRFVNLTHLNISGIEISTNAGDNLAKALDSNLCSLEHLIMNNCQLTSVNGTNIIKKLRKCVKMRELHLSDNRLDNVTTEELVVSILHLNELELVTLEKNRFSGTHQRVLHFLVNNLKFSKCEIHYSGDVDGAIAFIILLEYMSMISVNVSDFVHSISKIKYLSLDCSKHSTTHQKLEITPLNCSEQSNNNVKFEVIASKFFTRFVNLTYLNISGIEISANVADNLAKALGSNLCSLEHLIMNNCQLTSENSIEIIKKLRKCVKMRELHLCNNRLDNVATEELVVSILHLNEIELLTLEKNRFSDTHQRVLHFLVNNLKFSEVEIDFSGDVDGAIAFIILSEYMSMVSVTVSDFVHNISKIKYLSLDCSKQSTLQQLEITPKASEFFKRFKLTKLNLSGIHITEKVINNNCEAFGADLTSVKYLLMNNCKLTSTSLMKLMKVMQSAKKIELCDNEIDDEAMESLVLAILHSNSLEYIKLEGNRFSKVGMMLLKITFTEDIDSGTVVDFKCNDIVVKSFIKVLDFTNNNHSKRVAQFLNNLSKATELFIQVHKSLELTLNASKKLKNLRNLIALNFSGIIITEQVADNLCQLYDSNQKSLKQLIMNSCGLNSNMISKFAQKLKLAVSMVDVQFCENKIDDSATKPLATAILHWNVLKGFKLENNCFTDSSIRIFDTLNEFLEFCDTLIDFNGRTDQIIPFITLLGYMTGIDIHQSILIENVTKIKKLVLNCSEQSSNNVKFEVIASKFFTRFVNLTHLNISGIEISANVADNLAKALDSNLCSLEHLIMNNCQLTSVNSINIIKTLHKCVKLRELHLCNNQLDNVVTEELVVSILHLNELELLTLDKNHFSDTHKKVFHFLVNNLKFSECEIDFSGDVDGIIAYIILLEYMATVSVNVSDFVHNISKIKNLSLDCSKQSTTLQQLEITPKASKFFRRFNKLRKLNLSGINITEKVIDNLCEAFEAYSTPVDYLLMNNSNLDSGLVQILLFKLRDLKLIPRVISLCNNLCDDSITNTLIIFVRSYPYTHIYLEGNKLSEESNTFYMLLTKEYKYEEISFTNIRYINHLLNCFDYFCYSYEHGETSQFTKNVMNAKELRLPMHRNHGVSLSFEASHIFCVFNNLTCLDISGIAIVQEAVDILVKAFSTNLQTLIKLFMNSCQLTSKVAIKFIKALHNKNIEELQMCDNLIDDEATEAFTMAILEWKSPRVMLVNNKFSETSLLTFRQKFTANIITC